MEKTSQRTFIIQFIQYHEDFRLPEIESLARLHGIALNYEAQAYSNTSPYFVVYLKDEQAARKLVERSILVRSVHEYWADGSSMDELHYRVKHLTRDSWENFKHCSFRFNVHSFQNTYKHKEQVDVINQFAYLGFQGPVDLIRPEEEFDVFLEHDANKNLKHAYFGRYIASSYKGIVEMFDVKKRRYIGNTTMDAQLSLIMANQALTSAGKIFYDPFVGTGSFIYTCGHFGAYMWGSDIDGRQIRGMQGVSIRDNLKQYGIESKFLDCMNFDIKHNPWRNTEIFDAIVTDPPYGVRAGAKTLGNKRPNKENRARNTIIDLVPAHLREDYIPATKPYEFSQVIEDLLVFAERHLVPAGRLVYWMPTATEEYKDLDVPTHQRLRLIANSLQDFGKWGRRLITMEKLMPDEVDLPRMHVERETLGHFDFREKYYRGFRKTTLESE